MTGSADRRMREDFDHNDEKVCIDRQDPVRVSGLPTGDFWIEQQDADGGLESITIRGIQNVRRLIAALENEAAEVESEQRAIAEQCDEQ